jgi:hypothetical protein
VYESPAFLDYFREATPIEAISELRLGSRPARRSASARVEELRAIPWVFSWTQNRHGLPDKLAFSIEALAPVFGDFKSIAPKVAPEAEPALSLTDRIFAAFQHKADMAHVVDFLVARGQLNYTEDGSLESIDRLDAAYAARMLDEPDRFAKAVNEWVAANQKEGAV